MKTNREDENLYRTSDEFYELGWSRPIYESAKAIYNRLNINRKVPKFSEVDIDTLDHYCIAARHAVRAFYKSAEGGD